MRSTQNTDYAGIEVMGFGTLDVLDDVEVAGVMSNYQDSNTSRHPDPDMLKYQVFMYVMSVIATA